jgi:hypothetical protein
MIRPVEKKITYPLHSVGMLPMLYVRWHSYGMLLCGVCHYSTERKSLRDYQLLFYNPNHKNLTERDKQLKNSKTFQVSKTLKVDKILISN